MKAKNILFKTSGILKCVVGGCVAVLFVLVLLLSGTFKEVLLEGADGIKDMVNELVELDKSYAFLNDMEISEVLDYFMGYVNGFAVVMMLEGLITVAFGVFNIIFASKHERILDNYLGRKMLFTILMYLLSWELITNILSTIAIYLKPKNKQETKAEV